MIYQNINNDYLWMVNLGAILFSYFCLPIFSKTSKMYMYYFQNIYFKSSFKYIF